MNDLQEEFKIYREKMELENNEKQMEIDKLMKIINLYETSGINLFFFFFCFKL